MNKVFLHIMITLPNPPYCISPTIFRIINLLFPQQSLNYPQQWQEDVASIIQHSRLMRRIFGHFPQTVIPFSYSHDLQNYLLIDFNNLTLSVSTPQELQPTKKFTVHSVYALTDIQILQNGHKLFPPKHSRILFLYGQKLFYYNCACVIWLLTAYTYSITFKMTTIVHVTVKMSCLVVALLFHCQFIISSKKSQ